MIVIFFHWSLRDGCDGVCVLKADTSLELVYKCPLISYGIELSTFFIGGGAENRTSIYPTRICRSCSHSYAVPLLGKTCYWHVLWSSQCRQSLIPSWCKLKKQARVEPAWLLLVEARRIELRSILNRYQSATSLVGVLVSKFQSPSTGRWNF